MTIRNLVSRTNLRFTVEAMALACLLTAVPVMAQTKAPAPAPKPNYQLPSTEFNKELPKWLKFSGNYQGRLEGFTGGGYKDNSKDAYFLNRYRLNMAIAPSAWLRFNFQAQDSRVWGKNTVPPVPPFQNRLDLRLAYVEVGDPETKTWGLRAGRQELAFGEMRLIGHLNWMNTARTFDAVRATYRHKGARIDAFASSVVAQFDGQFDRALRTKADNLHGIWASLPTLVKGVTIEPYVLWRVTRGLKTELGATGKRDFKTYGIRFTGKFGKGKLWDYGIETNGQKGSLASDSIGAWAGHYLIGYTTPGLKLKPRWLLEYNYASGDKNPTDGKRGTFDQLYPTGHDKIGFADQVGWKNIHNPQAAVVLKPNAKWSLTPRYHMFWLASATDSLYTANGSSVVRSATGAAGRWVGQEVDFTGTYAATKQMTLAMGYAHLFPGTFLKKTTPGKGYNYPFLMVQYNF